jgi:mRNA interferase MazF
MKNIKRGQVWEIDLTPTKGAEIEKVRPCVVVSSDTLGVLPISTFQARSVSIERFITLKGSVSKDQLDDIVSAIGLVIEIV